MSALTDLFTAMANKIRSKTGTATTYTPSEMASDGIDDVYDAGVASATTSITPSNASPVSMTANTGYKPTANGYAISSYSSVTPSSTQTAVSSGDIVKIGGSGVIVDSVPTPTSLTPSNSSPATITSGGLYQATANGKAVLSVTNITPSNASPVPLGGFKPYIINNGSALEIQGYAIGSFSNKTPSDSNPPSVASGDIVKMGGAGYLVANIPVNLLAPDKYWQGNISGSGSQSITVTKKPRYVIYTIAQYGANNGYSGTFIFDAQNITGIYYRYQSSGYTNGSLDDASGWLTSVTASSITVKNNMSSTVRAAVIIYY